MTIKPMIILPDPVLRKVSEPIERIDDDLKKLAGDMLETMYEAPGIGLAAIQVGVPRRLLVLDVSKDEDDKDPKVVINPTILSSSDDRSVYEEGCLSIPEFYADVERPAEVTVRYTDLDGKEQEVTADGLFATCLQHEIDHLDGVLFIDYLSRLKRDRVIKKFTKASKQNKL
ncbi:peptide deformylase [Martelella mediterranea]|uniref:Peptide deformylase n=1 Tax=Martelella mediterranea TaxID=293089 RepID=A0A4R3NX64_9HYPH|nr:peptide deformylase [Martelella mediterranea]TCT43056.1 peptide deformylase [Martelella mediterranea]